MNICVYKNNRRGFTFIELAMGISVMLLGFSFFTVMYKYYSYGRNEAIATTEACSISQNVAKEYENNNDITSTLNDINAQFPDYETYLTAQLQADTLLNLVTISVIPKKPRLAPYILIYYSSDKSIMK